MKAVTLIFPHQLFKEHPAINKDRDVYLIEEELFFNQYNFHRQKLIIHRASMKMYEELLTKQQISVRYVEATHELCSIRKLIASLAKKKCYRGSLC